MRWVKGSLVLIVVSEGLQGADQRQRCLASRNAMRWAALEQRHDAGATPVDLREGARPSALKRATPLRKDPAAGCAGFSPREAPPVAARRPRFKSPGIRPLICCPRERVSFL